MGDVAKEVAEIWKKVTEDEKKKYLDLAETDKERYATAMSVFNEKNGY